MKMPHIFMTLTEIIKKFLQIPCGNFSNNLSHWGLQNFGDCRGGAHKKEAMKRGTYIQKFCKNCLNKMEGFVKLNRN